MTAPPTDAKWRRLGIIALFRNAEILECFFKFLRLYFHSIMPWRFIEFIEEVRARGD